VTPVICFRVESRLEPEPTRHSGTDNHTDKDPSSSRRGGCWAWLRRRNGNGKSDGNRTRAHDPTALGHWYQQHLRVSLTPSSYQEPAWRQEAGPIVFSPFPETSDYFGDPHKDWIVNFRVRDLDKMAAQLQAAGIAVKIDPQSYPNGRFARLHDPSRVRQWQDCRTRLSLSAIAQRPTNFCSSSG
jgi:glyoxylase I family protein